MLAATLTIIVFFVLTWFLIFCAHVNYLDNQISMAKGIKKRYLILERKKLVESCPLIPWKGWWTK